MTRPAAALVRPTFRVATRPDGSIVVREVLPSSALRRLAMHLYRLPLPSWCGQWRWFRRLHGGHWEEWTFYGVFARIWITYPDVAGCTCAGALRPFEGYARHRCEEWP